MPSQSLDFYSVSAQVVPVLFIALAFETRAFGRLDRPAEKDFAFAGLRLYVFILIVWGEFQALHVLSTQRPTHTAHDAVVAALALEGLALAVTPAVAFLRSAVTSVPPRFERYTEPAVRVLFVLIGLAFMAIGVLLLARSL